MIRLLTALIRMWQWGLSGILPPSCRYLPSCSEYAVVALQRHGLWRGGWLATRRLCRCHPWGRHGFDPVPAANPQSRMTCERVR